VQIANERTKTVIEIEKSGQSSQQRFYLIAGGLAGLVAATGGDSAGVSQTDAGRPWRQRPLGWSFMGCWEACIVSHNGDYGTLGILVEGGWSGGWSDGRRNVSPDCLINYPMQAVHPVYHLPLYCNGMFC